ncbi:hypothetical protein MCOR25_006345 [Pyricularia grisea]|nr:hypothetical protein MCOR25_006345 [Pyricularia grisea]
MEKVFRKCEENTKKSRLDHSTTTKQENNLPADASNNDSTSNTLKKVKPAPSNSEASPAQGRLQMAVASHKADPLGFLEERESVTASKKNTSRVFKHRGGPSPATNLSGLLKSSAKFVVAGTSPEKKKDGDGPRGTS